MRSLFSTEGTAGFFDAPFPVEHMRRPDGTIRYDRLPNPDGNPLVEHYVRQADRETNGFSRAGPIYLPFDGLIDETRLPRTVEESLGGDAKVFLVNVDETSQRFGERIPVHVKWQAGATKYRAGNLLCLLPYQGYPLAPGTVHAAVVLATLRDPEGRDLAPSPSLVEMREGREPKGTYGAIDAEALDHLWHWCDAAGIARDRVAATTVFRTGEFVSEMKALRDACAALPDPVPRDLRLLRDHPTYTIVEGKLTLPIWQDGERPYWTGGGKIHFTGGGEPLRQWDEEVRFAVSVPKARMPVGGFPLLLYSNGQGGTYTQVFDRAGLDDESTTPGEGPALQFAARGIACLDIEAPTVGPRHPTGSYAGIAFPNALNLVAFRDNIRQAASEFTMLVKMARRLGIPPALVPAADTGGESEVRYDAGKLYFWGHSTGAGIGELVLAVEPSLRAGMVSGAGVSWIYNLIYKQEPLDFRSLFQSLTGEELDEFHPLPLLFQNVCDPSEAAYFAERWIREPLDDRRPPNVFILNGIFDRYFPPILEDGLVVASGVDLAGPVVWEGTLSALALSGRTHRELPLSGNLESGGKAVTAAALQYETPADVDGHYAPFVLPRAKHQYSCFFGSHAATGVATIPVAADDPLGACGYE